MVDFASSWNNSMQPQLSYRGSNLRLVNIGTWRIIPSSFGISLVFWQQSSRHEVTVKKMHHRRKCLLACIALVYGATRYSIRISLLPYVHTVDMFRCTYIAATVSITIVTVIELSAFSVIHRYHYFTSPQEDPVYHIGLRYSRI